jgi:predicted Zn finger-like uncharacterized protein
MKIVCDACQAKYSIADEKIQGKAFKIRCKKCNHIIVVKNTGEGAVPASAGAEKQKPAPAAPSAAAPPAADQAVWHVVVDGEQVGPLSESEVKEKLRANQIDAETLVWKEGFADWTALSSVPELTVLQSKAGSSDSRSAVQEPAHPAVSARTAVPSTASPDPGDVFAAPTVITPASADLFAAAGFAPSSAPQASPAAQAVPSPVAPAPSSPFLFGGAPAQPAEPAIVIKNPTVGPGGTHLTGQRNENSVLFSLSNLEALAVPSGSSGAGLRQPSSSSNTEGSGLIDIRSMAAMTLKDGGDGRRSSEALPTFSTPQFSPVAPVLLPISNSGPPKWVYPVLGLLAVGILVLGFGIYRIMSAPAPGNPIVILPPPAPPVPPSAAMPTAAQPTQAAAPAAPPTAAPEGSRPVVEEKPAPAAEEKPAEKSSKSSKGEKRHKGEKRSGGDTVASSGEKPADKKAVKEIGAALGDFGKKEEPPKPAPAQPKLVSLSRGDIVNAMKIVQPRIQACANQYKVPGTAMATIAVIAGGKVSGATVTGKFVGTPTGSCVESAAKSAKFPPCQAMTFPWPFTLSPR